MFDAESSSANALGIDWTSKVSRVHPFVVVHVHRLRRVWSTNGLVAALPCVSQGGFVEGFTQVAAEFVKERNLRPVRVALIGPPGSGKSTFAAALGRAYHLPVIAAADVVALVTSHSSGGGAGTAVSDKFGPVSLSEELSTKVAELVKAPNARLPNKVFTRAVHAVLSAPRLRNRGYVCSMEWLLGS